MSWVEPRKHGCRMLFYQMQGFGAVTLENRALRVTVLPDKGSDIIEFRLKARDLDVLWASPMGLRNPRVTLPSSEGLGPMADFTAGGWHEILPSGGPPSSYAGANWGQHGETTTLPWETRVLTDKADQVALEFRTRLLRYPILIQKTLRIRDDRAVLEIEEHVTNEADESLPIMWGHHPTVGAPFLSSSCRLQLPKGTVRVPELATFERQRVLSGATGDWPHIATRDGSTLDLSCMPTANVRTAEYLYITDLAEGWYAITNADLGIGFGLCWDIALFPHLWYWQVARGAYGYPWYGRTYCMALEPWTSWPGEGLVKAVQQGTALWLAAGQSVHTFLYAVLWEGKDPVQRVTADGPHFV
jgi:hypothetical protein